MKNKISVFVRKYELDNIETYIDVTPEALADYRNRIKDWADKHGIPMAGFGDNTVAGESGSIIHTSEGTDTITPGGAFDQKSDRTVDDVIVDDCKE